jgi:hypothetical protein
MFTITELTNTMKHIMNNPSILHTSPITITVIIAFSFHYYLHELQMKIVKHNLTIHISIHLNKELDNTPLQYMFDAGKH